MTFYTYLWLREDGTPYYVGKGQTDRAYRKGSPSPDRIIVQDWPSETDALEGEKFLIACYGRKDNGTGILRNRTDGGEGISGHIYSAEALLRMSERMRGNKIHLGYHNSLETRQRMSASRRGKKRKPFPREVIQRIADSNRGKRKGTHLSPVWRKAISESLMGPKHPAFGKGFSENHLKNLSTAQRLVDRRGAKNAFYGKSVAPDVLKAIAGLGAHVQWHVKRNLTSAACRFCTSQTITE